MKLSITCAAGLVLAALSGSVARANDSAFSGVSGTPEPLRGEHRSIAMQSEKILITADAKGYSTDVDFVFRNDGAATRVPMGFPESSFGDVPAAKKSAFLRFTSSVDGQTAETRRIITSAGEDSTEAYWVKTVAFARHQTRRVRVSYRSPWGGNVEWGTHHALLYNFTGKNWKGLVERSDLEIRVAQPGLWLALPRFDAANLPMSQEITPKLATFRKTWRNWQAQGTFTFGLTRMVPFWMLERATLSTSMATPERLKNAVTFRIGSVPKELPDGAETPPAFVRGGSTYISLGYLRSRLEDFRLAAGKNGAKIGTEIRSNPQTRSYTLSGEDRSMIYTLGSRELQWKSQGKSGVVTLGAPPILLRGQYDSTLYVPLKSAAQLLGLGFTTDPKNRLFTLEPGSWAAK